MSNKSHYIVEVEHLWKVFPPSPKRFCFNAELIDQHLADGCVAAVRDVSFQIKAGEVFIIMGLSGSGKSTLIRCLSRLIEPTAGRVRINRQDVTAMDSKQLTEFRRTEAAMVFQHYGLLPHRNVLDNVSFGLKLRGMARPERDQRAREAIEKVGLSGWETYCPEQLSGGMQQRIGIARALVQDTNILLMDEPFSGLDPLIRREMQDELLRLQNELHKTIIFVTHDVSEAIRLGDRMAVMKNGVFVQTGTPREIIANPVDDYVQRFVQDQQKQSHIIEERHKPSNVLSLEARSHEKTGHKKVQSGR